MRKHEVSASVLTARTGGTWIIARVKNQSAWTFSKMVVSPHLPVRLVRNVNGERTTNVSTPGRVRQRFVRGSTWHHSVAEAHLRPVKVPASGSQSSCRLWASFSAVGGAIGSMSRQVLPPNGSGRGLRFGQQRLHVASQHMHNACSFHDVGGYGAYSENRVD